MNLADAPDVLTVPEAAQLLRAGRNQTYDLIHRGELDAVRVGRSLRVPKAALMRFLQPDPKPDAMTARVGLALGGDRPGKRDAPGRGAGCVSAIRPEEVDHGAG